MPDKEKVITHFQDALAASGNGNKWRFVRTDIIEDTIALLREQKPLTVHDPGAVCLNCKWPLYPEDHPNYCGNCGKKIKWDG